MKLESFRELLAKKAGDPELAQLIKFMREDVLATLALESLEKMAVHKGDKAPSAMTMFAGNMTKADVDMLHDALGHHVSKYRAAKEAGDREIANQHLERAVHLMDFAARAQKHSHGKLIFDHIPTHAWEMNNTGSATRIDKHGKTKYVQDQKGLGRRLSSKSTKTDSKGNRIPNMFEDYTYLEQEPHSEYKHKGRLGGHSGGYPFEDMTINGKHIVIDHDTDHSGKYEPHEFDQHPIFERQGKNAHWERKEDTFSGDERNALADKFAQWEDSPHVEQWENRHEKMEEADPEGYAARGREKSKSALSNVNIGAPKIDTSKIPSNLQHLVSDEPKAEQSTEQSAKQGADETIDASKIPDSLKHLIKAKDPEDMSAEELIEYYRKQESGEDMDDGGDEPEEGGSSRSEPKAKKAKRSSYIDDLDPDELKAHKAFAHHWTTKAGQQRKQRADARKNPVLFAEGHRDAAHNKAHEAYNQAYYNLVNSDEYKDMSSSKKRRAEREFKKNWLKDNPEHLKNAASSVAEAHKMHGKAGEVARKEREQQTNYILSGAPQGDPGSTMSEDEAIQHAGGSRDEGGNSNITTGSSVEASFANANRDFINDYRNKMGSSGTFDEYIEELDNPDRKLHSHPVLDHPENKQRESKMMKEYGSLIDYNVNKMKSKLKSMGIPDSSVDEGDLKVAGMYGLFSALRDYNPQSGSKFASHAGGRIQGHMQSHVKSLDPIPQHLRDKLKMYEKMKNAPKVESQESQAEVDAPSTSDAPSVPDVPSTSSAPSVPDVPSTSSAPKAPSVDTSKFTDEQRERHSRILSARRAQKPGGEQ